MARLLTFSHPGVTAITPITGPMARNSGSNTASDGSEQTFTGIGDLVGLNVEFNKKKKGNAREQRGNIFGIHAGANAIRFPVFDPDIITPYEAGITVSSALDWVDLDQVSWSNGENWSNGQGWSPSAPVVSIASASALDSGLVQLADSFWGRTLPFGSYLGFFPFHFGLYCITEILDDGWYRIWPRLRKALTTDDYATLFPTIVMRPHASSMPPRRGLASTDDLSLDLYEVIDPYVRSYFTD